MSEQTRCTAPSSASSNAATGSHKNVPFQNKRITHLQKHVLARYQAIFTLAYFNTCDFMYVFCTYRMGSFNSAPKINNADTQDDYLEVPHGLSTNDLVQHCRLMRGENQPQLLSRNFLKPTSISNDLTDGMRVLKLNSVSKGRENISTNIRKYDACSNP